MALAVTLLSGAGLLIRTFQELAAVHAGFDSDRVTTLNVSMTWAEALPGNDPVGDRVALETTPGVEAAAFSAAIKFSQSGSVSGELALVGYGITAMNSGRSLWCGRRRHEDARRIFHRREGGRLLSQSS